MHAHSEPVADILCSKFDPIPCLVQWEKTQLPPSIQSPSRAARVAVHSVLILYNPYSGAKKGESVHRKASDLFQRSSVKMTSIRLERRGHAEEVCRTIDLAPYDVVVPIGGDGTIHECVNGTGALRLRWSSLAEADPQDS